MMTHSSSNFISHQGKEWEIAKKRLNCENKHWQIKRIFLKNPLINHHDHIEIETLINKGWEKYWNMKEGIFMNNVFMVA
jgi:hypothetical protein